MLTSQEFIIDGYQITLDRGIIEESLDDTYGGIGESKEIETGDLSSITVKRVGEDHKFIELPTNIMRELVHILKDSPYIFSESNK